MTPQPAKSVKVVYEGAILVAASEDGGSVTGTGAGSGGSSSFVGDAPKHQSFMVEGCIIGCLAAGWNGQSLVWTSGVSVGAGVNAYLTAHRNKPVDRQCESVGASGAVGHIGGNASFGQAPNMDMIWRDVAGGDSVGLGGTIFEKTWAHGDGC